MNTEPSTQQAVASWWRVALPCGLGVVIAACILGWELSILDDPRFSVLSSETLIAKSLSVLISGAAGLLLASGLRALFRRDHKQLADVKKVGTVLCHVLAGLAILMMACGVGGIIYAITM